jgi:hypothetical protein
VQNAKEEHATDPAALEKLCNILQDEAFILESLGRLDEAIVLDAECLALSPDKSFPHASVRLAKKHIAAGEDAEAEQLLKPALCEIRTEYHANERIHKLQTSKTMEDHFEPSIILAELLERRGTEEALAEAKMLRDEVAQELARHEVARAALLEETRTAAAEAVRQWREERSQAKEKTKGGKSKGKSKKKGKRKARRAKAKAKDKEASSATTIEGGPPHEPAGGEGEGTGAAEGAIAAEAEQQAPVGESELQDKEEEAEEEREECAICLQDLELEDDEDACDDEGGEGEALVVLQCGHRFHAICGDMWCAKCAKKGWGGAAERRMWLPGDELPCDCLSEGWNGR